MGHAEDDLLQAFLAATLDDLLQRRDQRFTAVEAEALGALVLDVDELLEALGLDQLRQDRLLAVVGELDALARTFDAFLDPVLFFRIGNMHELDAERRAIGPLEDVEHFRDGRVFETKHVVDEDLAAVIGLGEAIGARRKLVEVLDGSGDAERVEIGMKVTAHAVGTDHHDGAHRIAGRLKHIGFARRLAGCGGGSLDLRLDLGFDGLLDHTPIAVERRDEVAIGGDRPVLALPGGTGGGFLYIGRVFGERLEEGLPFVGDGFRIVLVTRVELLDIGSVRTVEERRDLKLLVGFLPCHGVLRAFAPASRLEVMTGDRSAACLDRP